MKWQQVNIDQVCQKLNELQDLSSEMTFLSEYYPCLYIYMLKHLNQEARLAQYMKQNESFENDPLKYSLRIHGYLIPWLDQQRERGNLKEGEFQSSSYHILLQGEHVLRFLVKVGTILESLTETVNLVDLERQIIVMVIMSKDYG